MLFKINANTDVFKDNPELQSVLEFERCTDKQFRYVALLTDYKSPFRKLGIEDKKYQAAVTAGYKLEKDGKRLDMNGRNLVAGKVGNVEAAIKKYRELQKDEDYETLLSLSVLIGQIRDLNAKPDKTVLELEKAVAISTGKLDKLVETKKKLENIIEKREDFPTEAQDNPGAFLADPDDEFVSESSLSVLDKVNAGIL